MTCYRGLYFRLQIAVCFESGQDTLDTLLDCFFVRFDDEFGMLRLFIGIVHAGKARDLAFVHQFVQSFDVALRDTLRWDI